MKGFTLYSLVRIALKNILVLIFAAVVFAVATFTYCEFVALPVYSASGSLIVTNGGDIFNEAGEKSTLQNGDIVASKNISDTIIDILSTKSIYKSLANSIDNKYTYSNLISRSSIAHSNNNSLAIRVSFTANNSSEAVELVNSYLQLAPEYIKSYFPQVEAVVLNEAESASQTYPRTITFTLTAACVGAIIAYSIILVIYSTNTVIRTEEDFKERFDINVIGAIPDFARARQDKYYYKSTYYGRGGDTDGK